MKSVLPFTILIDTAETHPYTFEGIKDKKSDLHVPVKWLCLGRHPHSLGDYAIAELLGKCHVERKSVQDLQGTLLGFKDRRPRFECELGNLSQIECAAVVVEGTLWDALTVPDWISTKPPETNAKILHRTILRMQQQYPVPWLFCDNRRLAEITTLRWFEKFYERNS